MRFWWKEYDNLWLDVCNDYEYQYFEQILIWLRKEGYYETLDTWGTQVDGKLIQPVIRKHTPLPESCGKISYNTMDFLWESTQTKGEILKAS